VSKIVGGNYTFARSDVRFKAASAWRHAEMHIPATIRTTFGPSSLPIRATVRVTLTHCELFAAIRQIEREADEARALGNDDVATRLDWRAAALREAAR
jgi:hypothetical protein